MLKEIIEEIKKDVKETMLKVKGDTILECSTRIYNSQNINESKDKRIKEMKSSISPLEPATEKQKETLLKMGYPDDVNKLNKSEAHALISEVIERRKSEVIY